MKSPGVYEGHPTFSWDRNLYFNLSCVFQSVTIASSQIAMKKLVSLIDHGSTVEAIKSSYE